MCCDACIRLSAPYEHAEADLTPRKGEVCFGLTTEQDEGRAGELLALRPRRATSPRRKAAAVCPHQTLTNGHVGIKLWYGGGSRWQRYATLTTEHGGRRDPFVKDQSA